MIIYLTTAETDLLSLSQAVEKWRELSLEPVNAVNLSVDYDAQEIIQKIQKHGRVVMMRLLGGRKAAPALFDAVVTLCQDTQIPLMVWPGDLEPSDELLQANTVDPVVSHQAMQYAAMGGVSNFLELLRYVSDHWLGTHYGYQPPFEEPWTGIYWPGRERSLTLEEWRALHGGGDDLPVIAIVFYRAHWLSGNVGFVDHMIEQFQRAHSVPLPIFTQSLKTGDEVTPLIKGTADAVVVTMSFSAASLESAPQGVSGRVAAKVPTLLEEWDLPIFQAMVSLGSQEAWQRSALGLAPLETAMNVAIPEFDGRIITVPISFREDVEDRAGIVRRLYVPRPDRVERLAGIVSKWARLRKTPVAERRIAIVLTNYPSKNSRIGNAVGLDTPMSLVKILEQLAVEGYDVGPLEALPRDGDDLMRRLIGAGTHDEDYVTWEQLHHMPGLDSLAYTDRFGRLGAVVQSQVERHWGLAPGSSWVDQGRMVVPGLRLGNIFVGIQPPRGNGDDEVGIYHSPELPPSHHYMAYYQWIAEGFRADAVIHLGKHGTLEWLPGKGIGLSQDCFPDIVLGDLPNFYPFIVDDPGEGTQAKRRSHAVIVDHMVPPVTQAGLYDDLVKMQQLLDQYYQAETLDPTKLPMIQNAVWELAEAIHLNHDLKQMDRPDDFSQYLLDIDGYLCELEARQIRDGLHILGQSPTTANSWGELLYAMTRLPLAEQVPSAPAALCAQWDLSWEDLQDRLGEPFWGHLPAPLEPWMRPGTRYTKGDVKNACEQFLKEVLGHFAMTRERPRDLPRLGPVLDHLKMHVLPHLQDLTTEIAALSHGLEGGYVPPGPSGAPTRGMTDVLPTGRNFYSVDPRGLPSVPAWHVGKRLANELIEKYVAEHHEMPVSVAIVVWGTAAMRTGGDDIAEILALLGVKPLWEEANGRVKGLELIGLQELGRPRVDVTVRISGFFRDAFRNVIDIIHEAVEMVAQAPEPLPMNPVRAHWLAERAAREACGDNAEEAAKTSLFRVFGSQPGSYGSGILPLLHTGQWQNPDDLARVYLAWSSYAYTATDYGIPAPEAFRTRMASVQIATKNQDNREHDIFDSDDYLQDHGGMAATIRSLTGAMPDLYFGDSSDPGRVGMRSFQDEAYRVFRSRVVNPRWIEAAMRHHYKGALEMANTMDFLFGYDATADLLDDWMYEQVAQSYVLDPTVQQFMKQSNPWALKDITERLLEANDRGMWENPSPTTLEQLQGVMLDVDNTIEEWGDDTH
ncbi:cobaltochelatase subunit CobN [Sulfobacillus sp. hq2]|uniref:cobaltochelatase subunit CobN n=1 Tax=Sulfobacillus sp. hq2 TaxID=2039167 RepID=UPI000CD2ED24|nr:cobaltochelatase subunit CobN [Sulfobacillus sp. hq2]POB12258.1 cobaltochelatase subunit CobN [Sulfobacillus sp. hq2]